jgi:hypothetical protein
MRYFMSSGEKFLRDDDDGEVPPTARVTESLDTLSEIFYIATMRSLCSIASIDPLIYVCIVYVFLYCVR